MKLVCKISIKFHMKLAYKIPKNYNYVTTVSFVVVTEVANRILNVAHQLNLFGNLLVNSYC